MDTQQEETTKSVTSQEGRHKKSAGLWECVPHIIDLLLRVKTFYNNNLVFAAQVREAGDVPASECFHNFSARKLISP